MDEAQSLPSQEQEGLADEVNESLGMTSESRPEDAESSNAVGEHEELPKGVQERLARQKRKHERELKMMNERINNLHSQYQSQLNSQNSQHQMANNYSADNTSGVEEHIHKAVSYALQQKELAERKAREEQIAHANANHYREKLQDFNKHLEDVSDKYDDFDDVVRDEKAPFTQSMIDVSLLLPRKGAGSAGEVLYKLGKNPQELERISKLHPMDMGAEMVRLSNALIGGESSKMQESRPLGQIKSNPITNSRSITEKTPISEIRKQMRMKEGLK